MTQPETRYALSGDAHIAYQILGEGSVDVLMRSYGTISIEGYDREPHAARFLEQLGSFARIIRYDRRGVGLSDPPPKDWTPSLSDEVADAVAVLDHASIDSINVFAPWTSGAMAILMATTEPERVNSLILCNTYACFVRRPDYPWGMPEENIENIEATLRSDYAEPRVEPALDDFAAWVAPSLSEDKAFKRWWEEEGRRGASPATAQALGQLVYYVDVREQLPAVRARTLVLHRSGNQVFPLGHGTYLADHIPDARFVELEGTDQYEFAQGAEAIIEEIERFLTGTRQYREPDRVLTTILFTDIVGSTGRAAAMGDRMWKTLHDRHDDMARDQIERFGGREIRTTGDGFLATLPGPAIALRCAGAICEGAQHLGIEVRAGIHTGEVEVRSGGDITGIAVVIARRVCDVGGAGSVLVSEAVPPLVVGSDLEFLELGSYELKGVPGRWRVLQVNL